MRRGKGFNRDVKFVCKRAIGKWDLISRRRIDEVSLLILPHGYGHRSPVGVGHDIVAQVAAHPVGGNQVIRYGCRGQRLEGAIRLPAKTHRVGQLSPLSVLPSGHSLLAGSLHCAVIDAPRDMPCVKHVIPALRRHRQTICPPHIRAPPERRGIQHHIGHACEEDVSALASGPAQQGRAVLRSLCLTRALLPFVWRLVRDRLYCYGLRRAPPLIRRTVPGPCCQRRPHWFSPANLNESGSPGLVTVRTGAGF